MAEPEARVETVGASHTANGPLPPSRRIDCLDALRGLALFGVLAINLETLFRISIFEWLLPGTTDRGADLTVDAFLEIFLDLKAFTLFSLLFGIGLGIQFERLQRNLYRTTLLVRRLLALLIFGCIHLFFIWNGDILVEYAIVGLIALPFLFAPSWFVAGTALALLSYYISAYLFPTLVVFPSNTWMAHHVAIANQTYGTGTFSEIFAFRLREIPAMLPLHEYIFPRTLGLFLLGVLIWRRGVVRDAQRYRRWLWLVAIAGICGGILLALWSNTRWFSHWPPLGPVESLLTNLQTVVMALGYAALVLAISATGKGRWLSWVEPLGRMAFSNYILQSLLLSIIFYGFGFGLFGRLGPLDGMVLVFVIYAANILLSRWWLKRHRFGPLEWLWRLLMYGQIPARA